jgi:hypothetical protein
MRRVRIAIGLAVAVCAFSALTASAFAKEKLVFGKFTASIVGKTISKEAPAAVVENKEDEAEVTTLTIGPYRFGVVNEKAEANYEEPCKKAPKVTGKVFEESSSSLLTEVTFRQCVSSNPDGPIDPWKATSFKLAIRFQANESAELGTTGGGLEILEGPVQKIKGVAAQCLVEIPQQFVPGAAEEKEEKFYEAAEYTPESEEPENWEKSKKLKEEFPGGLQDRVGIETTEKFKGIRSLVDTAPGGKPSKGCPVKKGEANTKVITEKEIEVEGKMVPNPYYLWTEFTNGKIEMDAEGLEIKGGQLAFVPPA